MFIQFFFFFGNFVKNPSLSFLTGKNASLTPIIIDGKINSVVISNEGSEYTSPPDLEVVGVGSSVGSFAKLRATVSNGKITNVQIVEQGAGYVPSKTAIIITPTGKDASFSPKIQKWEINSVERYESQLANDEQLLQKNYELEFNGNKIEEIGGNTIESILKEIKTAH